MAMPFRNSNLKFEIANQKSKIKNPSSPLFRRSPHGRELHDARQTGRPDGAPQHREAPSARGDRADNRSQNDRQHAQPMRSKRIGMPPPTPQAEQCREKR